MVPVDQMHTPQTIVHVFLQAINECRLTERMNFQKPKSYKSLQYMLQQLNYLFSSILAAQRSNHETRSAIAVRLHCHRLPTRIQLSTVQF